MKYCSECGHHPLFWQIPAGDNRPRFVCPSCKSIHYQNPNIIVGTLPIWQDKVLLCKRAIEPRYGLWTLPAGFMENDENVTEGALRETHEEAKACVNLLGLYTVISVPHINQVHMMFRADLTDLNFGPGEESLEVALFSEVDIPWDLLAFRTIASTLKHYFADRATGEFPLHVEALASSPHSTVLIPVDNSA